MGLLHDAPQDIDFGYYRSVLKNTAVIDEIEAAWKAFKPKTYDVSKTLAAINQFEAAAVKNAETTKAKVDAELQDLSMTLKNIEEARSFDQLTVDDVANARPDIDVRTEQMVQKGRWMPPGYKEKFGDLSVL